MNNFHEFASLIWCIINTHSMVNHTWPSNLSFYFRFWITLQGQIMVIEFSTGCISYTKDVISFYQHF